MKLLTLLFTICLFAAVACKNKKPAANRPPAADQTAAATQGPAAKPRFDPDSPYVLKSLDPSEVFALLFDSPRMQKNTAIWKPHFSERMSFRVSYDDSCHTVIDTVLHFTDQGNRTCAVIVFVTWRFIADDATGLHARISDCHSCGATVGAGLFSLRGDGKWEMYAFDKSLTSSGIFGGSGEGGAGEFSLLSIGDSWTALLLKEPVFANMGQEQGYAELFSVEEFNIDGFPGKPLNPILTYSWHHSVYDEPGMANEEDNTVLKTVKKKGQYSLIQLVTTKNKRPGTAVYRYSEDDGSFVRVGKR